jgi:hypothetical protein
MVCLFCESVRGGNRNQEFFGKTEAKGVVESRKGMRL